MVLPDTHFFLSIDSIEVLPCTTGRIIRDIHEQSIGGEEKGPADIEIVWICAKNFVKIMDYFGLVELIHQNDLSINLLSIHRWHVGRFCNLLPARSFLALRCRSCIRADDVICPHC